LTHRSRLHKNSAVCAPARTTIRTGCTIERTGIQHNDLVTEYQNGKWFQDRVESLVSLDHVLVETRGYLSEYYGKWHIPDKLMYSKANGQNIIQYNDYDFAQEEPYFLDDSDGRKNMRFLEHFQRQGMISKDLQDGQQYDTYTGFPYTPIQLDSRARHGSPTGTPLTTNHGFEIYEITQPNVVGEFALSDDYTPSHFTAHVANEALLRLKQQSDPWFLTVSFHNPHPPMIPASKHLEYYWSNRESLFVSPNMIDDLSNSAYGNIVDKIPDYQDEEKVKEWTALYCEYCQM
jgi:arylsulfatase A-like enzyme